MTDDTEAPDDAEQAVERLAQMLEPPPEEVANLAASCIDYVRQAVGVELDVTPETLPILDHYLAAARTDAAERPELLALLARTVGAYFGEVVRGAFPAFWWLPSADPYEWRLCFREAYLSLRPMGVAYDALVGSTHHEGPSSELGLLHDERECVAMRLAQLPPVPEDEWVMLSTRLEAIEIAQDAVRRLMQERGVEDTQYAVEDYDDAPQRL